MEELENKHTSEVAKLQKQIDALDNQIIRLQMSNSKRYAQYSYWIRFENFPKTFTFHLYKEKKISGLF